MYHVYHTEGLILGGRESGESSRHLFLLTKDLGFIPASVQGLRTLESRLRYSLQDFSFSKIDLVRGKGGWRVISAGEIKNFRVFLGRQGEDRLLALVRICRLLRKLLRGEEQNVPLFDNVLEIALSLGAPCIKERDIFYVEMIGVMRILNHLGYWGGETALAPFLRGSIQESVGVPKIGEMKSLALREINKSLHETQL